MNTPLAPWRGDFDRAAACHLLRRAGLGYRPAELEQALETGLDATLERLFAEPQHEARLLAGAELAAAGGKLETLQAWWMALMLQGRAPLLERLTLFWHDHFATGANKVEDLQLVLRQNQTLRAGALGDFRELLGAMARDPAMLLWLDGNENKRGHPNENFARELFELFALGIGNYAESDVLEAARAFTGWGTRGRVVELREHEHDPGEKQVLGQRGAWRGDDVLRIVSEQPACARHVARRLSEEFVGPDPARELVDALAQCLVSEQWNIGRSLRVLLASQAFFAPTARRARIAGPVEFLVLAASLCEAQLAPLEAARRAGRMGQDLFRPPSVKGWDGGRAWIQAAAWIERSNSALVVARAQRAFAEPPSEALLARLLPDLDANALRETLEAAPADPVVRAALLLGSAEFHLV